MFFLFTPCAVFLDSHASRFLGTFQNPQLLELSGIGDKDVLNSFGIDTKIDLPGVGENLRMLVALPTLRPLTDREGA